MNCTICNHKSAFFFEKVFEGVFKEMISSVDYYKCKNCGFTFSPTIFELNELEFSKLNITFHEYIEDSSIEKIVNQPPYIEQAIMINVLDKNKLIDMSDALDFAGGYGTLNKILTKYFNSLSFKIYDPYMQDINNSEYISKDKLKPGQLHLKSSYEQLLHYTLNIKQIQI